MFDHACALLKGPQYFPPLDLTTAETRPVADARLAADTPLVVLERDGQRLALLIRQFVYHHVAQGFLGDQPVAAAFCIICHSAVGFIPVVHGRPLTLSCGGVYRGAALLVDAETETYWDHITGRGLHGPLAGASMEAFTTPIISVRAALERWPDLALARAPRSVASWLFGKFGMFALRGRGFMPPPLSGLLGEVDDRLPAMTEGLGVIARRHARFYPLAALKRGPLVDDWGARALQVELRAADGLPEARWRDRDEPPLQLFTRWYAFAFTFPHCPIYGDHASGYG